MAACVKAAQSARTNVSVAFWTDSEPLASSSKTGSFPPIAKVSRYDMRPEPYAVIPLVRICAGGGVGNYCLYRDHTSCSTYSALILQ
jgi:hypothetical protein